MIILVRHAQATGQPSQCPLTDEGVQQSSLLGSFLSSVYRIDQIISSPFQRAIQTAKPLADLLGLSIKIDDRLAERKVGETANLDAELEQSFIDYDFLVGGYGESNNHVRFRAQSILNDLDDEKVTVLVSHGNFSAVFLNLFTPFSYHQMCSLTNPDVFLLQKGQQPFRLWTDNGVPYEDSRKAARAIVLSPCGNKVYLLHLVNSGPQYAGVGGNIWITPGGGIEGNEAPKETLIREMHEELNLKTQDYEIISRLGKHQDRIHYKNVPLRQYEVFYLIQAKKEFTFNNENHTEEELHVIPEGRWWTLEELSVTKKGLVPAFLCKLIDYKLDLTGASALFQQ